MQPNINYNIWFRVAKPIKHKYGIATNTTLVLNGAYVLNRIMNKPFTRLQLRKFLKYWDNKKIDYYIDLLIKKSFIELVYSSPNNKVLYYSITQAGISVINDLNDSYQIELSKFCQKYNIEL